MTAGAIHDPETYVCISVTKNMCPWDIHMCVWDIEMCVSGSHSCVSRRYTCVAPYGTYARACGKYTCICRRKTYTCLTTGSPPLLRLLFPSANVLSPHSRGHSLETWPCSKSPDRLQNSLGKIGNPDPKFVASDKNVCPV